MHKLYKSETDKILFGVCGGLAEYFEMDSTLMRLIFILFTFAGGGGVLLYLLLALLIPKNYISGAEADPKEKIKEFAHKAGEMAGDFAKEIGYGAKAAAESIKEKRKGKNSNFFGILLVAFGFILLINEFMPDYWTGRRFFWPIFLMLFGFYLILRKSKSHEKPAERHEDNKKAEN